MNKDKLQHAATHLNLAIEHIANAHKHLEMGHILITAGEGDCGHSHTYPIYDLLQDLNHTRRDVTKLCNDVRDLFHTDSGSNT